MAIAVLATASILVGWIRAVARDAKARREAHPQK
jgi:hypothetical protein